MSMAAMSRRAGSIVAELVAAVVRGDTARAASIATANAAPDVLLVLAYLVAADVDQAMAEAGVPPEAGLAVLRDTLVNDLPVAVARAESLNERRCQ